jgi:hypothetical protein
MRRFQVLPTTTPQGRHKCGRMWWGAGAVKVANTGRVKHAACVSTAQCAPLRAARFQDTGIDFVFYFIKTCRHT